MRSLALYITYAIHKPWQKDSRLSRTKSLKLNMELTRRKTFGSPSNIAGRQPNNDYPQLTELQVALKILALYTDCLCQKDDLGNIHRFAKTVTNKVSIQADYVYLK